MTRLRTQLVRVSGDGGKPRHPWRRLQLERLEDRAVPDSTPAAMLDPNLQVSTVISSGITQPIGIVFLGANDFFVLEKASGQVKRVTGGVVQPTAVLDLAVNSNSERGLLSMALHPNFPTTPFVYVRWTESSTGADSAAAAEVQFLGNRVDRYSWNGSTLTFDRTIVALRARQTDNVVVPGHPGTANNNENGNHNGGVIRFGPDGKLYIFSGDLGRRGQLQNLPNGPFLTAPQVDDTFGGPAPDNAHLTGMILRLNDDGTTPTDNPFFAAGAAIGGEVGANIQKMYSYGHRNGFGMAFDPVSGAFWVTENSDDAYSELNRVTPGMNGGWVQFMGPQSRAADWKFIETTQFNSALQQVRYPPTRAAYTATQAISQMFMLPGATYVDPDLSWRYEIGPAGTTFVTGNGLGAEYNGTLWFGSARSNAQVGGNGGSLYRLKLTANRLNVDVSADPRLADRVADNLFRASKFDGTESESLRIGTGFGITPSIEMGPDGNLYVVSNTDNTIYRISLAIPQVNPGDLASDESDSPRSPIAADGRFIRTINGGGAVADPFAPPSWFGPQGSERFMLPESPRVAKAGSSESVSRSTGPMSIASSLDSFRRQSSDDSGVLIAMVGNGPNQFAASGRGAAWLWLPGLESSLDDELKL